MDAAEQVLGWRRLDQRMLLVHPVRELVRYLPAVVGLLVFGRASDSGGIWGLVAIAVPVSLGVLRYLTTSYRLTASRVEVRHGLVTKQVVSAPLDRVRTVDLTASPIHRALGLVTVRIGTGQGTGHGEERLSLDGLSVPEASALRRRLLHVSASADASAAPERERRVVLTLDPRWVRFAPLTSAGLVMAGAALGLASQAWHELALDPSIDVSRLQRLGVTLVVTLTVVTVLVVVCVLAVVGYLVTNFGFQLSHTRSDGSWHLRRGLFTTRETSLDDARVSGVSIGEPLGLRLARGARLSAIVTGLDRKQQGSSLLVPPAPRAEVDRVAAEVLGRHAPVYGDLVTHSVRARRRRWTRALVPAAVVAVPAGALTLTVSWWFATAVVTAFAVGAILAHDRWRSLGHALADGCLVARSGSLDRRREALHTASVIGWNLRSTWFQRRAGLTDLVATTAGGRQQVRVLDLDAATVVPLVAEATPGLLEPFLEG
jgi:putative membrane protein